MSQDSNSHLDVLLLDPTQYPGGIAIWGALPAVYDTSIAPQDSGVHVHARMVAGGEKSIDETFNIVTHGSLVPCEANAEGSLFK